MRKSQVRFKGNAPDGNPRSVRVFDRTIPSNHYVNFYEESTILQRGRPVKVKDPEFEAKLEYFLRRPERYEVKGGPVVKKLMVKLGLIKEEKKKEKPKKAESESESESESGSKSKAVKKGGKKK